MVTIWQCSHQTIIKLLKYTEKIAFKFTYKVYLHFFSLRVVIFSIFYERLIMYYKIEGSPINKN